MGAKKEKKSHYVVTEITKTQPLYLCCRAFSLFFEFSLTLTYYSRCEQLIRLSELLFFSSPSTWMRLDSPQLQPVSSSLRDVFIVALTSNPFQIPSSLYLHLLCCVLHTSPGPAPLHLSTTVVIAFCNFVTAAAAAAPPPHLRLVPFHSTSVHRVACVCDSYSASYVQSPVFFTP